MDFRFQNLSKSCFLLVVDGKCSIRKFWNLENLKNTGTRPLSVRPARLYRTRSCFTHHSEHCGTWTDVAGHWLEHGNTYGSLALCKQLPTLEPVCFGNSAASNWPCQYTTARGSAATNIPPIPPAACTSCRRYGRI